jgi:hypothetical protein
MDFFGQTLCVGDRVAFITNKGLFQTAQIIEFQGEDPYRYVKLYTDGKRETIVRCSRVVREP